MSTRNRKRTRTTPSLAITTRRARTPTADLQRLNQTRFDRDTIRLSSGQRMDRAAFDALDEDRKRELLASGSTEAFNSAQEIRLETARLQAEREQQTFLDTTVGLSTDERVSREAFEKLSPADQKLLRDEGIEAFNASRQRQEQEFRDARELAVVRFNESTVALGDGARVDKGSFQSLPDFVQEIGVEKGLDALNETYERWVEGQPRAGTGPILQESDIPAHARAEDAFRIANVELADSTFIPREEFKALSPAAQQAGREKGLEALSQQLSAEADRRSLTIARIDEAGDLGSALIDGSVSAFDAKQLGFSSEDIDAARKAVGAAANFALQEHQLARAEAERTRAENKLKPYQRGNGYDLVAALEEGVDTEILTALFGQEQTHNTVQIVEAADRIRGTGVNLSGSVDLAEALSAGATPRDLTRVGFRATDILAASKANDAAKRLTGLEIDIMEPVDLLQAIAGGAEVGDLTAVGFRPKDVADAVLLSTASVPSPEESPLPPANNALQQRINEQLAGRSKANLNTIMRAAQLGFTTEEQSADLLDKVRSAYPDSYPWGKLLKGFVPLAWTQDAFLVVKPDETTERPSFQAVMRGTQLGTMTEAEAQAALAANRPVITRNPGFSDLDMTLAIAGDALILAPLVGRAIRPVATAIMRAVAETGETVARAQTALKLEAALTRYESATKVNDLNGIRTTARELVEIGKVIDSIALQQTGRTMLREAIILSRGAPAGASGTAPRNLRVATRPDPAPLLKYLDVTNDLLTRQKLDDMLAGIRRKGAPRVSKDYPSGVRGFSPDDYAAALRASQASPEVQRVIQSLRSRKVQTLTAPQVAVALEAFPRVETKPQTQAQPQTQTVPTTSPETQPLWETLPLPEVETQPLPDTEMRPLTRTETRPLLEPARVTQTKPARRTATEPEVARGIPLKGRPQGGPRIATITPFVPSDDTTNSTAIVPQATPAPEPFPEPDGARVTLTTDETTRVPDKITPTEPAGPRKPPTRPLAIDQDEDKAPKDPAEQVDGAAGSDLEDPDIVTYPKGAFQVTVSRSTGQVKHTPIARRGQPLMGRKLKPNEHFEVLTRKLDSEVPDAPIRIDSGVVDDLVDGTGIQFVPDRQRTPKQSQLDRKR